ncbi:hypothetical protein SAMN06265379_103218 [Saccharicrinis carchari]|uniref:HTH domain-containing protein n=1 Tax=Saccharicrinis carchari TaxID=1168039 RepID=A0A521CM64_SACCC|nr:hypothetical protein SAMN06265379_103218 [Saccharicrinis carchari]
MIINIYMMTLNDKSEQIDFLATLIVRKRNGKACQLAKRINVLRSKLYDMFNDLKLLGVDIKYDRRLNTFYYGNNLRVKVNIPIEIISEKEIGTINGGKFYRSPSKDLLFLN